MAAFVICLFINREPESFAFASNILLFNSTGVKTISSGETTERSEYGSRRIFMYYRNQKLKDQKIRFKAQKTILYHILLCRSSQHEIREETYMAGKRSSALTRIYIDYIMTVKRGALQQAVGLS